MDLLRPTPSRIQFAEIDHQKTFVGFCLFRSGTFPFPGGCVDPGRQLAGSTAAKRLVHPMI